METEKKGFDFWQDHSRNYLEMAFSVDRRERIAHADGYGKNRGECGDTVEFFLTCQGDTLQRVSFETDGCTNTNACCNAVAALIENRDLDEAWSITPDMVVAFLETLPKENHHCAELAVGALYRALADVHETRRNPWKKGYR